MLVDARNNLNIKIEEVSMNNICSLYRLMQINTKNSLISTTNQYIAHSIPVMLIWYFNVTLSIFFKITILWSLRPQKWGLYTVSEGLWMKTFKQPTDIASLINSFVQLFIFMSSFLFPTYLAGQQSFHRSTNTCLHNEWEKQLHKAYRHTHTQKH